MKKKCQMILYNWKFSIEINVEIFPREKERPIWRELSLAKRRKRDFLVDVEIITVCWDCQMENDVFQQNTQSHDRLIHIAVQFAQDLDGKQIKSILSFSPENRSYPIVGNEYVWLYLEYRFQYRYLHFEFYLISCQ